MSNERQLIQSRRNWPYCLWPGLARLWFQGDFSALATAVGFTLLLNMALMSTFLWTSWPGKGFPIVIWPIVGLVWFGSAFLSFFHLGKIVHRQKPTVDTYDTLLIRAQTEYLKGNWSEVQSLISQRLKKESRDVPARLLLASLFRHTGNLERARQQLDILDRFDESESWQFEITRERDLIHKLELEREQSTSDPNDQRVNNLETNRVKTSVELIDDDRTEGNQRKVA